MSSRIRACCIAAATVTFTVSAEAAAPTGWIQRFDLPASGLELSRHTESSRPAFGPASDAGLARKKAVSDKPLPRPLGL